MTIVKKIDISNKYTKINKDSNDKHENNNNGDEDNNKNSKINGK